MKSKLLLVAFLLVTVHVRAEDNRPQGVIVLSIDGGKPAVLKQAQMPELHKIFQEGAGTWDARTIFPSITLPAHTSMFSGIDPDRHKVKWNSWIRDIGPFEFPTAFSLAKIQGKKVGVFATKEKFKHFNSPAMVNTFEFVSTSATGIASIAIRDMKRDSLDLAFVHFAEADSAGHKYGWGSREQYDDVKSRCGAQAASDYIRDPKTSHKYTLIITADHGGSGKGHGSASLEDSTIPWTTWGASKKRVLRRSVSVMDTGATALSLLGVVVPNDWQGRFVSEAYLQ